MSNLIPEKRVDKNGVLTTKHVRAGAKIKASLKSVPAPSVASTLPMASTTQKRWRVNNALWKSDLELAAVCRGRSAAQTYQCSEADAFTLMTAVSPENVLPLLAMGIRTASEARDFLNETGMARLISDNTHLASEAVVRGISARDFITFVSKHAGSSYQKKFMDAAEVDANPVIQQVENVRRSQTFLPSISTMILIGYIRTSDLKELGDEIILENGAVFDPNRGHRDLLWNQLNLLKKKKLAYKTASELRQMIEGLPRRSGGAASDAIVCAGLYGIEGIPQEMPGWLLEGSKLENVVIERSIPERRKAWAYAIELRKNSLMPRLDPEAVLLLSDSGITPSVAVEHLNDGLTVPQVIALQQGQVAPSISKGWL